jgi:two-component system chemotaxis response regulator CheY
VKILIADDSGMARLFIRQCVEIGAGCEVEVIEVENGQQAFARLKADEFDLLVTDLNMPVLDGRELIRRVRADTNLRQVAILVISSSGNSARRDELLALGATVVLRKPINPIMIAQALETIRTRELV